MALAALLLSAHAAAQDETPPPPVVEEADGFKFGGEIKAGYRWSQAQDSSILSPSFRVVGLMRTPDAGSSVEI